MAFFLLHFSLSANALTDEGADPSVIQFVHYNASGDGVADDAAALAGALADAAGKTLLLESGKIYRSTTSLVVPEHTTVFFNGAVIDFQVDGSQSELVLKSYVTLHDPHILSNGTNAEGLSGNNQCPILIGNYHAGTGEHDIRIVNARLESNRADGNLLMITGDSYNITIDGITLTTRTPHIGILIHWGGAGNYPGGVYQSGFTRHPHDIGIYNLYSDFFGSGNGEEQLVRISGAYNILIDGVAAHDISRGIQVSAGDASNDHASPEQKSLINTGIVVRNTVLTGVRNMAFCVNGDPVGGTGADGTTMLDSPVLLEGVTASGAGLAGPDTSVGVLVRDSRGMTLRNSRFSNFYQAGIDVSTHTQSVRIENCEIDHNGYAGIVEDGKGTRNQHVIAYNYIHHNNRHRSTEAYRSSGIYVSSEDILISHNILGAAPDETQSFCVYIDGSALRTNLLHNQCLGVAPGGVAFQNGKTESLWEMMTYAEGNRSTEGIAPFGGTPFVFSDSRQAETQDAKTAPAGFHGTSAGGGSGGCSLHPEKETAPAIDPGMLLVLMTPLTFRRWTRAEGQ